MTGFGVANAAVEGGRITLEVRSVNHRFIDVRVRLPRDLAEHTAFVEQHVRSRVARGRVEISIWFAAGATGGVQIDRAKARAVLTALDEVRRELGLAEPVPLSVLAAVPDLFTTAMQSQPELVRGALRSALDTAIERLDEMKRTEGEHLRSELHARLAQVRALATQVATHAPELVARQRTRLKEKIARLLDDGETRPDAHRIEQEIAILAANADIAEELSRLQSHCAQFDGLLAGTDSVGRRMDFLLQEMTREVNTMGSKTTEAEVTFRVVELKAEIDRMREQVQNVE